MCDVDVEATCVEMLVTKGLRYRLELSGDDRVHTVKDGNQQAIRLAIHMLLAKWFDIRAFLEQPLSSVLNYMPFVEHVFDELAMCMVVTWLGSFGGNETPTPKPIKVWGNVPANFLLRLRRTRPNLKEVHSRTFFVKYIGGVRKVTGMSAPMVASGAYPSEFGEVFVKALKLLSASVSRAQVAHQAAAALAAAV